jgi:transcriptional regulator with XRE-family HTH domain
MDARIRKFMDYKGITPSQLADTIGVQRSNVTHVLNGRNKPSFQFIEKMLQIFPDLNAKWLLLGEGIMVDSPLKTKTLFDQQAEPVKTPSAPSIQNNKAEYIDNSGKPEIIAPPILQSHEDDIPPVTEKKVVQNELQDQFFSHEKPIERIVVFFKDQTFKVYSPSR